MTNFNLYLLICFLLSKLTFYLEFANICLSSTEFHFLDLENQIDVIRKTITKNEHVLPNASVTLDVGDFYVTKHSNLSEVHVVYHLISDDLINSSDINANSFKYFASIREAHTFRRS